MVNPEELVFPESFESPRLEIRAPRIEDDEELNAAVHESLESLRPWMPWAQTAPTLEETRANTEKARQAFIDRKDMRLNLFLKATGAFVGGSGLHRIDWEVPKFEIGYWIRDSFTGQGYATEAVEAITQFAFEQLHARRVEIRMGSTNTRSARVPERLGFQLEGVLRNNARLPDGTLADTLVYAKVR